MDFEVNANTFHLITVYVHVCESTLNLFQMIGLYNNYD